MCVCLCVCVCVPFLGRFGGWQRETSKGVRSEVVYRTDVNQARKTCGMGRRRRSRTTCGARACVEMESNKQRQRPTEQGRGCSALGLAGR
ncbi:hypothetical protein LY76DRAFT_217888 [Colletotrichum caudatum]|nr:hypothetical protein LY76DRAFT_217888 [Colletotrichum caudatum]